MDTGIIYKIENIVNGKMYFGQTNNYTKRKSDHLSMLKNNRHINSHLQAAYNKYGQEVFKFVEVFTNLDKKDLNYIECRVISIFNTADSRFGYNKHPGGGATHLTEETKRKIGDANRGRKPSPKTIARIREVNTGKTLTQEHRANISLGNAGKKWEPSQYVATTIARTGITQSNARLVYCLEQDFIYPSVAAAVKVNNLDYDRFLNYIRRGTTCKNVGLTFTYLGVK